MVDVGAKAVSERRARARARVRMSPQTAAAVAAGDAPKGEVLGTARLAGHPGGQADAGADPARAPDLAERDRRDGARRRRGRARRARQRGRGRRPQTGVEMEAMVAARVAALTVYDMVKGLERGVMIEQVALLEKTGGRSATGAATSGALIRVAILTVSTSRAARGGADEGGDELERVRARAGRRDRRARDRLRRARRDRGAPARVERRRGLRPDPDDRRDRRRAARRDAGGDARRDRARGARDRRGDARGLAAAHPPLDALARRRRDPRARR